MSALPRLIRPGDVSGPARVPGYDPARHGPGIVHIGPGAFHRAHQALYTDEALAAEGGDWRIRGLSLRGTGAADALNPQNGLYTLIERDAAGSRARVVGSIAGVIAASRDRPAVLAALTDPAIRIVTLTVTEKAYGIDRAALAADPGHPSVAADLADPRNPTGVLGLLAASLRLRRAAGTPPFTALSCDNLPDNGTLLRAGVVDFARRTDPELAGWIAAEVGFPASMVDRITPASGDRTFRDAAAMTGCDDRAAVEAEAFRQWVIEDRFPQGRPAWEAGGALFVGDVRPYEQMKLRMLNGSHSMLAYSGFLSGHRYVRDAVSDAGLGALVARHLGAAAATLSPLPGFDPDAYGRDLLVRFANPAIAHETYQIAMDGTEKLPQRLLSPALDMASAGGDIRPFAFAVAAWMRYCLGRTDGGEPYALRDPREDEIRAALAGATTAETISTRLHRLPGLFAPSLATSPRWRACVGGLLSDMLCHGMSATIARETERSGRLG